jgi:hypothetical protein
MRSLLLTCLFLVSSLFVLSQTVSQHIRGRITDESTGQPLGNVTVTVTTVSPIMLAGTDSSGNFLIRNVPVGRHHIQVSHSGYELKEFYEIEVGSGKEVVLNAVMKENIRALDEVRLKATASKERALNNMVISGGRMLSAEESKRYAGGFDDPARLVSAFAGVASNIGNNGIVVRGNAPKLLQWKMEGIEIPNPNHFADLATFGGGGLTAVSSQLLANSDFLTSAFPAEYNNALSGIFDMNMRTGNDQQREHTVQVGLTGIDLASEGPFKKGKKSSYLFNYRYSTLSLLGSLLPENAGANRYQDLSFKINLLSKRSGSFDIWGIGLTDQTGQEPKTDASKWEYESDRSDQDGKLYMGAVGMTHKLNLSKRSVLKTILAATVDGIQFKNAVLNQAFVLEPDHDIRNKTGTLVLSTMINTKFRPGHLNRSGFTITRLSYNLDMKEAPTPGAALETASKQKGSSSLISAYTSSLLRPGKNIELTLGLNGQFFSLNNRYTIEPRFAIKWRLKNSQSLSFAYGKHSRLEKLFYYFYQAGGSLPNKALDFTKAHHLVATYQKKISRDLHLKAELYYQSLYDVPVISDSSYSLLNTTNSWFVHAPLVNKGKGRNYGMELTLEKYMSRGYYFLLTGSVFQSKYKNEDGPWRDTRYARNTVVNILSGKEWKMGRSQQNLFGINIRASWQGGDRYSPIDTAASISKEDVVFNELAPFSKKHPAALVGHLTVNYKINRKKTSQELSLKLINATMYEERNGWRYNFKTNSIDEIREAIVVPNLSYKIEF